MLKKKSATQLQREIDEALARPSRSSGRRNHATRRATSEPEVHITPTKERWARIKTNAGTWTGPLNALTSHERKSAEAGNFEPLLHYTGGTRVHNNQSSIVSGYGVRLSAPGVESDWEIFDDKKSAMQDAKDLQKAFVDFESKRCRPTGR